VDFNKLLAAQAAAAPTIPRELYASLPEKERGYGYLRDVQAEVLEAWYDRRSERDLVIKVNTGAGKTIDGLVILQSYLNGGQGPALYVAPDKYLAEQVRLEAKKIGIATVDDPDDSRYVAGEVIAVVNASKLFNGRSVFSDERASRSPAPIGSVVIDDAHAALATVKAQLSIAITRDHPAFEPLLALFRNDLESQAPNDLLDVEDQAYSALAVVPFWAWQKKVEAVRKLLHSHRGSDALKYPWPAVSEVLHLSRAVFTGNAVTITPPCPPVRHITGFAEAAHRIYLTATLADDSVLVSEFGADPTSVAKPITPLTAGDIGERMILAPLEINPGLQADHVRHAIAKLSSDRNVVVLVPSNKAAERWRIHTNEIIHADRVAQVVTTLRNTKGNLVVLVNKYDGIDLPDDACRVLVVDGLPEAMSAEERLEQRLRRRALGNDDHQLQRIEQGMGRGVRSNEDHCVVFLLGPRLSQLVADPRSSARFSAATRAQLELSRTVAGGLDDAPLEQIMGVAHQALARDDGWVRLAKLSLSNIQPPDSQVSVTATERRNAFEAATDHNFQAAANHLSRAIDAATDDAERGWLLEQQAAYINHVDPERAQTTLVAARSKNRSVLRPISGITYVRLAASGEQAQRLVDFLAGRYPSPAALRLGYESFVSDLEFDPQRTDEFEEAMRAAGEHLGFKAERPEHDLKEGPDVLWALGDAYWVIEAKSGAVNNLIHKRDANQLGGSMNWFRERYGDAAKGQPVMVHLARDLAKDASPTPNMCVIDLDGLSKLKTAVRKLAEGLAAGRSDQVDVVNGLLTSHGLRASDLNQYLKTVRNT
jgi:hypothetical protein